MRRLLFVLVALLFALAGNGQYFTVTNLSGTVLYGTTNVTVTSSGAVSSIPYCGVNPYWIGSGSGTIATPGGYTFSFSSPVSAIRVFVTAADHHLMSTLDSEKIYIDINGSPYWLTPSHFSVWGGTCSQPAAAVLGGKMVAVVDFGAGAGGQLDVTAPAINVCRVHTNGVYNGSTFTFEFRTGPTNNGPLCVGDTLRLYLSGDSTGATYYWYGPGGFTSTLQNPVRPGIAIADSGLYYVVKTVGGIPDTGVTRLMLKPNPVIIASSNSPICQGPTNTLNLYAYPDSIGETYRWSGPGGFTSTLDSPSITGFTYADTGIYKVVATLNGCKDSATTHVIMAPIPPPPVISGVTSYCTGQPFVPFTVAAIGSVLWYTTGTGGVGSAVAPTVSTTVGGTYTFWASQTVLGCESNRDSITVTVLVTPPAPAITGTSIYCQFFTYVPPSATGSNILWYTSATGGTGSTTVPTINTNIPGTYTIYASQTVAGCEGPRASFVITVNPKPLPPVIVNNPGVYCPGQTFIPYTIITGSGVLWYNSATGGVGSPAPPFLSTVFPGTYPVWATQTLLGCESDRMVVNVTVYDSVRAGFTHLLKYGCKADTVTFTNTSFQTSYYQWDFGDGASSTTQDPVHIYPNQGVYTVRLLSRSATCIDSTSLTIDTQHPIDAAFTVDPNHMVVDGNDIICQGDAITFTDASTGTGLSYVWHFGDNNTAAGSTATHNYLNTGTYKVMQVITDFVPCSDTAYRTVFVDTISPVSISVTDTLVCTGHHITFAGNYSMMGNTGVEWYMGNGDSIKNLNPVTFGYNNTGTYTISARPRYRVCPENSATTTVTVLPPPVISLGPDTTICKGSVSLTLADRINAGNAGATWMWSTGAKGAAITITEPGTYTATVSINGCEASASVEIKNDCYINIPNVFTPNGDGLNDYFFPREYLTSGLISFKMEIFNRWGQKIFEGSSLNGVGWDGKYNNTDQPSGVYVYKIDGVFKDGQKEYHQGNVTLLR